jgi:hypothetical protein
LTRRLVGELHRQGIVRPCGDCQWELVNPEHVSNFYSDEL